MYIWDVNVYTDEEWEASPYFKDVEQQLVAKGIPFIEELGFRVRFRFHGEGILVPASKQSEVAWNPTELMASFEAYLKANPQPHGHSSLLLTGRYFGHVGLARPSSVSNGNTRSLCMVYGESLTTVLHELAHILGVGHDLVNQDGKHIMGPTNTRALTWSERSHNHVAVHEGWGTYERLQRVTGSNPITPSPTPAALPGDTTGDGKLGLTDVMKLLNYLYPKGEPMPLPDNADANQDGQVNLQDVLYMTNELFGQDK